MPKRRRSREQIASATDKACGRCDAVKPLAEFGHDKNRPDGLNVWCRECVREASRLKYAKNPKAEVARVSTWHKDHPENGQASTRRHRAKHDPDGSKSRAAARSYYHRNKESCLAKRRQWEKDNPEKHAEEKNRWLVGRRKRDPAFRLIGAIRRRVSGILAGAKNGRRTFDILGYTPDQLRAHVEGLFCPGMAWVNYGEWHLDHDRPVASYDFGDPGSMRECWALSNLKPMWGPENHSKSSLWDGSRWSSGAPVSPNEG